VTSGLGYQGNLLIGGLNSTNLQISDFQIGTHQKFADLRLRNEHKNLRFVISGLTKKIYHAHLWIFLNFYVIGMMVSIYLKEYTKIAPFLNKNKM
jgi:hypothetical protein